MAFHEISSTVEMVAGIGMLFLPIPVINALAGGYLVADGWSNHQISMEVVKRVSKRLSFRNSKPS